MATIQLPSSRPLAECIASPQSFAAQEMDCHSPNKSQAVAFLPTSPATIHQQTNLLETSGRKKCSLSSLAIPIQTGPPGAAASIAHHAHTQTIPVSQRAAITSVVSKALNVAVREVNIRSQAANEALVKILYTGICGSDVCFSTGPEPGYPGFDHIAGHEGIGEIVKCQDAALVNKIVGIRYLGATCGTCTYCLDGLPTSCPEQLNTPKQISGTFQEYVSVPMSCLMPLPEELQNKTLNLAPLCAALCSGSAALMALKAARLSPESVVVVNGVAGSIGHMVGAIARRVFGAKVIGVDYGWKNDILTAEHNREFADMLLEPPSSTSGKEWTGFITSLTQSCIQLRNWKGTARAADCLIICANRESAFRNMEDYVCDGGRIVCSGYVLPPSTLRLTKRD
ncbi:hypothetical protein FOBRF1_006728 [Fusarium oxysporum]